MYEFDALFLDARICGLCNRLRALVSLFAVAEARQVPMAFRWQPDGEHFDTRFEELFEISDWFPGKQVEDLEAELSKYANPMVCDRVNAHDVRSAISGFDVHAPLSGRRTNLHVARSRELLRRLVPVEPIRQRLEAFRASWPTDRTIIGVHVRRTDMNGKYGQPARANENLLAVLHQLPSAVFMVVSDNPDSISMLRAEFGDRVLNLPHEYGKRGRRLTSGADAVVDLYSLAACSRVIGTFGSSFSRTATDLGGIELEKVPWE